MNPALDPQSYRFLPLAEAVNPPKQGLFTHWVNAWWLVHPDKGLLFYRFGRRRGWGSPQCNTDERVTRMLFEKAPPPFEGIEVQHLPSAWVPADPDDYR
jgi:hypothetical protein